MGKEKKTKKLFFIGWMTLFCPLSIIIVLLIFERTSWVKDKSQIGGYSEAMDFVDFGRNFMRQGDFQAALTHFKGAIEIQPDLAEAYMALGNLYYRLKDNQAAITSFQTAISLSPPKKEIIYNDLGMIYVELQDFKTASQHFRKAVALGIRLELIWRNIALAEIALENHEEAIYACQQAIKYRPTLKNMYIEMLKEKLEEKDVDSTIVDDINKTLAQGIDEEFLKVYDDEVVRNSLRRNPLLIEDILNLALEYEKTDQIESALSNYRKVVDMQPSRSNIYNRIGILLAKQGRFWEAEETFIEALKVDPDNQGAWKALMKLRETGRDSSN